MIAVLFVKVRKRTPGVGLQRTRPLSSGELVSEVRVALFFGDLEAGLFVDVLSSVKIRLCPEDHPPVSRGAREGDAFVNETRAEAEAARFGLDEQEA